jgi:hypothetical protein
MTHKLNDRFKLGKRIVTVVAVFDTHKEAVNFAKDHNSLRKVAKSLCKARVYEDKLVIVYDDGTWDLEGG